MQVEIYTLMMTVHETMENHKPTFDLFPDVVSEMTQEAYLLELVELVLVLVLITVSYYQSLSERVVS